MDVKCGSGCFVVVWRFHWNCSRIPIDMSLIKYYVLLVICEIVDITTTLPLESHTHTRRSVSTEKSGLNHTSRMKTRILSNPNKRVVFGHENLEQEIIFPDSFEVTYEPVPKIDGAPKCAAGSTFCESFDAYPYQRIKEVLKENGVRKDLFGEDEAPNEIANRIGEDDHEMFVCRAFRRTVFPKVGKDKNNQWKYIVNQGDKDGYVQGILIETCVNEGGECDVIGNLPEGYSTSCKQKYVYRRLYSMDNEGKLLPDTFQIPSACCCAYKVDTGFLSRFGRPVSPVR